jgi:hypothetical protein
LAPIIGAMNKTSPEPVTVTSVAKPMPAGTPIRRIRIARMPMSGRPHLIVPAKAT